MAIRPNKILLQTTIPTAADDWSIARFSTLGALLRDQNDESGRPVYEVTMRDRDAPGRPDSVLSTIDRSDFHHFADYNWNPRSGCPSFVDGLERVSEALADTHRYALNIAAWLTGRLAAEPDQPLRRSGVQPQSV